MVGAVVPVSGEAVVKSVVGAVAAATRAGRAVLKVTAEAKREGQTWPPPKCRRDDSA